MGWRSELVRQDPWTTVSWVLFVPFLSSGREMGFELVTWANAWAEAKNSGPTLGRYKVVQYGRRADPALQRLDSDLDVLYVLGHCNVGQDRLGCHECGGYGLTYDKVCARVVLAGLRPRFRGAVKFYGCSTAAMGFGQQSFLARSAALLTAWGYRYCKYSGYATTVGGKGGPDPKYALAGLRPTGGPAGQSADRQPIVDPRTGQGMRASQVRVEQKPPGEEELMKVGVLTDIPARPRLNDFRLDGYVEVGNNNNTDEENLKEEEGIL